LREHGFRAASHSSAILAVGAGARESAATILSRIKGFEGGSKRAQRLKKAQVSEEKSSSCGLFRVKSQLV
jgi:hypothetical protein